MIHSMSGGIISDAGEHTFVKVRFTDGAFWYLSDFDVSEGDRVKAPRGGGVAIGIVERVERGVDGRVAPVPLKRAKRLICRVDD